jgi:hypothetical protein
MASLIPTIHDPHERSWALAVAPLRQPECMALASPVSIINIQIEKTRNIYLAFCVV